MYTIKTIDPDNNPIQVIADNIPVLRWAKQFAAII